MAVLLFRALHTNWGPYSGRELWKLPLGGWFAGLGFVDFCFCSVLIQYLSGVILSYAISKMSVDYSLLITTQIDCLGGCYSVFTWTQLAICFGGAPKGVAGCVMVWLLVCDPSSFEVPNIAFTPGPCLVLWRMTDKDLCARVDT